MSEPTPVLLVHGWGSSFCQDLGRDRDGARCWRTPAGPSSVSTCWATATPPSPTSPRPTTSSTTRLVDVLPEASRRRGLLAGCPHRARDRRREPERFSASCWPGSAATCSSSTRRPEADHAAVEGAGPRTTRARSIRGTTPTTRNDPEALVACTAAAAAAHRDGWPKSPVRCSSSSATATSPAPATARRRRCPNAKLVTLRRVDHFATPETSRSSTPCSGSWTPSRA